MNTQAGPCSVTPPYQSWGVLTGGCQEAPPVTVHGVPVLQRGIQVENMNSFTRSQPNKKVHLYKALVISQVKNWIRLLMIVELVSIQVMFCPSFPQVSCDSRLLRPCDLWASLCHPMPGDHSEAGTAKGCSAVVSSIGQPFQPHDKNTNSIFYLRNKHRYVTSLKTSLGNQWRVKHQRLGAIQATAKLMKQ